MQILVCIKQVPASTRVEVDPVTGVLKRDGADAKMNPYDLFALESAFQLREALGGEVTVLTMGPPQAEAVIREAYAMGADKGVILSDRAFAGADVLATAYAISEGARASGPYDLILCGKQTTDGDTAQVGSEVAEQLGYPSLSGVTALKPDGDRGLIVTMDMGDTVLDAAVSFPCVISVDKDICAPRLPSYLKKKATATREVKMYTFADLEGADKSRCGLGGSPTQVARIFPPEVNDSREMLEGDDAALANQIADRLIAAKFI